MSERVENILLGAIFGLLGIWMNLDGFGLLKTGLCDLQSPIQVVGGLIFFFVGSWLFFQGIQGPSGQNLPFYPLIRYFMVLPILAGLGIFFAPLRDGCQ